MKTKIMLLILINFFKKKKTSFGRYISTHCPTSRAILTPHPTFGTTILFVNWKCHSWSRTCCGERHMNMIKMNKQRHRLRFALGWSVRGPLQPFKCWEIRLAMQRSQNNRIHNSNSSNHQRETRSLVVVARSERARSSFRIWTCSITPPLVRPIPSWRRLNLPSLIMSIAVATTKITLTMTPAAAATTIPRPTLPWSLARTLQPATS